MVRSTAWRPTVVMLSLVQQGCFLIGYEGPSPEAVTALDAGEFPLQPDGAALPSIPFRDGSALPDDSWWRGASPTRTCVAGRDCNLQCGPQTCIGDCRDTSNCDARCGGLCRVDCSGSSNCDLRCQGMGSCSFACLNTSNCDTRCEADSSCAITCGASNCRMRCEAKAVCQLDCRQGEDCEEVECTRDAQCLVYCGSGSCGIKCDGTGLSCGGGVEVCNRLCP